jgi:hypothetical protein
MFDMAAFYTAFSVLAAPSFRSCGVLFSAVRAVNAPLLMIW